MIHKSAIIFLLLASALLAQPAIELSITTLGPDTLFPGMTFYPGGWRDTICVKNTGTVPLELGLSGGARYWHLDTIGFFGDTLRMLGEFGTVIFPPPVIDTTYNIVPWPRYCGSGYFGPDGAVLNPGDSVFLFLTICIPGCPMPHYEETLSVFVHARRGPETATEEIKWPLRTMGSCPAPPESIWIDSIETTPGAERVFISSSTEPWMYCSDYYHVYRDTVALFYSIQLFSDTTSSFYNLLPRNTYASTYVDSFSDTLWHHYWGSSKGVQDTLVNLFYVFTTVDTGPTAPGGFAESPYPSWCLCEYDQPMHTSHWFGSKNVVSIPCVHDSFKFCSDLEDIGVNKVDEWDASTQQWVQIGFQLMPGLWIPDSDLLVSHVYRLWCTDGVTPSIFSTYKPGIVPSIDTTYTIESNPFFGGRNVIMLPFLMSFIDGIHNCEDLEFSIEDMGAAVGADVYKIGRWDASMQEWRTIGMDFGPFWLPNAHLRPGMPYRIWVKDATGSFSWPW